MAKSISDLIMEYFKKHPNENLKHINIGNLKRR